MTIAIIITALIAALFIFASKLMHVFMSRDTLVDFEQGLQQLKASAENQAKTR